MSYFESNETISSSLLTASVFQIPNDGVSVINIMDFIYYFFQFHPEWRRGIHVGTREEEVPIRLNTAPHFTPTESEDGKTFLWRRFCLSCVGLSFGGLSFVFRVMESVLLSVPSNFMSLGYATKGFLIPDTKHAWSMYSVKYSATVSCQKGNE